jgi:hypothetical protein
MDLNQLTRDADELIRKVVSRYNQLYVPAGNISQVELDLMLDDMRRLYETFKTVGYVNLTLQNALIKPEVSVKSSLPKESEKTVADFPVFSEPGVQPTDFIAAEPTPKPEHQPEIPKEPQTAQVTETQTENIPEPIAQSKQEPTKESIPVTEIAEEKEPEIVSETEFENEAVAQNPTAIVSEVEKPASQPILKETQIITPEQTPAMLADKFNVGNKSLSETIGSSNSKDAVGSRMMFHPISDLSSGIGLNDKFSFISELFGNNPAQYDEAIARINKAVNADEATWILNKYQSNDWDQKQESLGRLKDFIKRRFI